MTDLAPAVLRRGSLDDLPSLENLWLSIHHHHAEAMPALAPYADDTRSWTVRANLYEELLSRPDTVLILAVDGGQLVGYGLAFLMNPEERAWLDDTWAAGPRVAEIESLGVLPSHRGRGLGSLLLDSLEAALADLDVDDVVLGVLAGNASAIRLYARRGFQPTWLYMSRLRGRERPGPAEPR